MKVWSRHIAGCPLLHPKEHVGLYLAMGIYLFLAFAYFFIMPIFEGPDEWTHTGHVKYIAEGNGLPVMLPGQGIWGGQQPPLYYSIGALLVQPFTLEGVADYEEHRRNPHASIGYALDPGNKNNYLHTPAENFPYRGLSLTVHILRLYSMSFGLITIYFTYLLALDFYDFERKGQDSPHRKFFALAVSLFVACQPMFAFITASVANEPANIAFCTIGLWLVQRYLIDGPTPHWGRAIALGTVLGLISLSKMTGLSFGLIAVTAFLQLAIATRKQSGAALLLWRDGFIIGSLFLLIGGWWYWRNYQLYGDFFQQGLYKIYFNVDPQPLTLSDFLYTLSTGEVSFWATFGWLNVVAPEWVYRFYRIISRAGLVGVIIFSLLKTYLSKVSLHFPHYRSPFWLHLIFPPVLAFSLSRLVAIEGGMQGRQLLPAIASTAMIIIWGWWLLAEIAPHRTHQIRLTVINLLMVILLSLAIWLPYSVVAQAYIPPPLITEAELPSHLTRLNLIYQNKMKLLGVTIEKEVVRPGERVPITAYWQALQPMEINYSVFIHLVGRDQQIVGQMNSYPALGLRPTSTLAPGQILVDSYPVRVEGGSETPTRLQVNIGLFDFEEPGRPGIPPTTEEGNPASSTVGHLKLIPHQWPNYLDQVPIAEFADHIHLLDYTIQNCEKKIESCQITFVWRGQGKPSTDYTVFIQLWRLNSDGSREQMTGFDTPPLKNDYPTHLWNHSEIIIDPHALDLQELPPGQYQILAGLYDLSTNTRLPVTIEGELVSDYALELDIIEIK